MQAEKSCLMSNSWPSNQNDGRDILSVWTRVSHKTHKEKTKKRTEFRNQLQMTESDQICWFLFYSSFLHQCSSLYCAVAWEASLVHCFHLWAMSLFRNRLYLTTVSLTESSSSSRMTLAGKLTSFLLLCLSSLCGSSAVFLHIFSLWMFQPTGRRFESSPWCLSSAPASFLSTESLRPTRRKVSIQSQEIRIKYLCEFDQFCSRKDKSFFLSKHTTSKDWIKCKKTNYLPKKLQAGLLAFST